MVGTCGENRFGKCIIVIYNTKTASSTTTRLEHISEADWNKCESKSIEDRERKKDKLQTDKQPHIAAVAAVLM
jgi:hypothetical protein